MPFNMHAWIYLSRHVANLISPTFCSDHEWMSWTLVSRLMQSALCNDDPSCATERMGGRNKHGIRCSSSVCGKFCGYEILMVSIDCNYFLLLISFLFVLAVRWVNSWDHTTPRKKQPGIRVMHEFLLLFTYSCLNQVFLSFRMILVLIKPLA
jgi:hypothetical protein